MLLLRSSQRSGSQPAWERVVMGDLAGHGAAAGQGGHGNGGQLLALLTSSMRETPGMRFVSDSLRKIKCGPQILAQ